MTVAVAICTRNRPEQLSACLASVLSDHLVTEILISSDGVDAATDEIGFSLSQKFPHVHYIRGPRLGLAANRNECIAACHSDYLLFLDDDARLQSGFLRMALPKAGPGRIVTGWESQHGRIIRPLNPDFLGFQRLQPNGKLRSIVINATLFPVAFLYRYWFDEFYQYGSEEVDMATAALASGMDIVSVDAGNLHLHVQPGRGGYEVARLRSRIYYSIKRYREYEPNRIRLVCYLIVGPANAILSPLRRGQFVRPVEVARPAIGAVVAGLSRPRQRAGTVDLQPVLRGRLPTVSVVITTRHRPIQLRECLEGIRLQLIKPYEVIVVRRAEDADSARVVAEFQNMSKEVVVDESGQDAALRAGAAAAKGDVIAFIDDDAVPRRDWIERIRSQFVDPTVAAVGGRDVVHSGTEIIDGSSTTVGRLTWWGRIEGNHHLGIGRAREVDSLRGCSCAYRRSVLKLPSGLMRANFESRNDLAISLRMATCGETIIYDPRIIVDQYPAGCQDEDGTNETRRRAKLDAIYNEAYIVASILPGRARRYLIYYLLVGRRSAPGVIWLMLGVLRRDRDMPRYAATREKIRSGVRDARKVPLAFI